MGQANHIPIGKRSDGSLWSDYQQHGDMHAFEVLYKRHNDRIFYFIYGYTKDHELAMDILQDTIMKILNTARELPPEFEVHNFAGWAIEFSRNILISRLRKEKKRNEILQRKVIPMKRKRLEMKSEIDKQVLQASISEVRNPRYQQILLMSIEGFSLQEMAQEMGLQLKQVRDSKYLAKREFIKVLKRKNIYEDFRSFIHKKINESKS